MHSQRTAQRFVVLFVFLSLAFQVVHLNAQTFSAAQEEELAKNFYANCLRSFGPDARLTPLGIQEVCRCSAITFSTNVPPEIVISFQQGQNASREIEERERASAEHCNRWVEKKQSTLAVGTLIKEERATSYEVPGLPSGNDQASPSLDGSACVQDASGLVRCSSGLVCTRQAGVLKCNNGLVANTDQGGLTRFSDGTSAVKDKGGVTRFSDGTTSQTDSSGLTRFSDGTTCTRDGGGLIRCQAPYGRLK